MARRANQRNRGLIRDRKTGVVLARSHRHPAASLFTAVPLTNPGNPESQTSMPPINMGEEFKQVFAIHLFDNLYPGLPTTPPSEGEEWTLTLPDGTEHKITGSKYRLVNPTGDDKPMGGNGETWLAWSIAADAAVPEEMRVDPADLPDVDDLSPEQLTALSQQIDQRLDDEARLAELDTQARPSEPEWMAYRKQRRERLAAEQAGVVDDPPEVVE